MASSRPGTDDRDELAQGLPATGNTPIGGPGDLDRPLGDVISEKGSGAPARSEPLGDAARASRRNAVAWKLLLIAGVLFLIGLVITLIADGGLSDGIGVTFMSLASVATLGGVGLHLFSAVERRSGRGDSFA